MKDKFPLKGRVLVKFISFSLYLLVSTVHARKRA